MVQARTIRFNSVVRQARMGTSAGPASVRAFAVQLSGLPISCGYGETRQSPAVYVPVDTKHKVVWKHFRIKVRSPSTYGFLSNPCHDQQHLLEGQVQVLWVNFHSVQIWSYLPTTLVYQPAWINQIKANISNNHLQQCWHSLPISQALGRPRKEDSEFETTQERFIPEQARWYMPLFPKIKNSKQKGEWL